MRFVPAILCAWIAVSGGIAAEPEAGAAASDPETVVREALAAAESIPRQAETLIDLAWPDRPSDPRVAAHARKTIVEFGEAGLPYLRRALRTVPREHQENLVWAIVEAYRTVATRIPVDYLPALEEAVWFGTEGARRAAIPELGRLRHVPSLLTIIDAAHENPALAPLCIDALGKIGDERARFYLERQLQEGKGDLPALAAAALASIGKKAILPLKAALGADRRIVREAAARAFVGVASPDDVSALAEYAARHAGDDPETMRRVREATVMLEKLREAREAAEAASSAPEEP